MMGMTSPFFGQASLWHLLLWVLGWLRPRGQIPVLAGPLYPSERPGHHGARSGQASAVILTRPPS
jgi:hypothetical protein